MSTESVADAIPDPAGIPTSWPGRARYLARRMLEEWRADRVPDLAAEVAFYAILSLFPAVLALASILGLLDGIFGGDVATETQETVLDYLATILTDEADGTLEAARDLFSESRPGLLTFSLLAALWALSRGFAALVRALDVVYDLDEHRPWLRIRLTALALAVGSIVSAAILLGMFVVGPLFGTGQDIADEIGLGDAFVFLWDVVRIPVAFGLLVVWAATIFHIAPDHETPWKWDLPGAVLTGVLWVAFSGGLRLYLQFGATSGNAVFGALGGALIVLLWFWVLSLAVLIGGELNELVHDELRPALEADREARLAPGHDIGHPEAEG